MKPSSATAATPARLRPPAPAQTLPPFSAYVYERDNPLGWHSEWWLHVGGCRKLLKIVRHTLSHEIHAVVGPADEVSLPPESRR